jgi:translocation and assembly module TamB
MRRPARITLHLSAGVVILISAALITGLMVLRSGWFEERVRDRIVSEIQKATGARVDFGNFRFDWTHLAATAGPVVIHGREAPSDPPLVALRSVTLGLRIISMLERKFDLASLRIDEPAVHLIFYPDGSTNIPVTQSPDWVQNLFDIAIGRYEVTGGLVAYDDREIPLNLRGEDLEASMNYERSALRYRGEIKSRRVRTMIAGFPPLELDVAAAFVLDKSKIELSRVRVATRQSVADVTGVLNDPRAPHGTLAVKANLSVREAVDAFRLPIARTGTVAFSGQLALSTTDSTQFAITGRALGRGMGYARDRVRIETADVNTDVRLTTHDLRLSGVSLKALGTEIEGSADLADWSRFHFNGKMNGLTIRQAARFGTDHAIPWDGKLGGEFSLDTVIGQETTRFSTSLAVTPAPDSAPIEGQINATYDQSAGKLLLQDSRLATRSSSLEASGTLGETLAVRAQSSSLDDVTTALALAGIDELPAKIAFGHAAFRGTVTGPLDNPVIAGDASVANASIDGHSFDRFQANLTASRGSVKLDRALIARGPTEVEGSAEIAPPGRDAAIHAQIRVRNAPVAELLKESGVAFALSATAAGTVTFDGTIAQPHADIELSLDKPAAFGEQLDHLQTTLQYAPDSINVLSGDAVGAAGHVQFQGSFQHRDGDWKTGDLRFNVTAQNVVLTSIKKYAALGTSIDSRVEGKLSGSARLENGEFALKAANGDAHARSIVWQGEPLGDLALNAATEGVSLALRASGKIRGVPVDAQGTWKLEGDEPGSALVRFSRLDASTIHKLMMTGSPGALSELPFEGFLDGATANVAFPLRRPRDFQVLLQIRTVQINPRPSQSLRLGVQPQDVVVRNTEPVAIAISAGEARIRSAKFFARDTSLEASGSIAMANFAPDLNVRGSVNLVALQLLNPDLAARGNATVQANVRGTMRDPQVSGRMELKNASLYLTDFPNGIDNANGTVLFDRNRATIEKLRAETGGGTVDFSGFLGFGSPLIYRLQAVAQKVRVRYPEDVSVTFNATLALNGTSDASTLSGLVTLTRASFTPRADLGQILAQASKTAPAQATTSDYIRGTHFDVRVESGPNFTLETSLTRNLEGEVDLRLRGTPVRPALVGTASVNEGEIEVFGNRYTVNRGDVRFMNPVRIDPVFDVDLETKARGVTVDIAISGNMQKLNVNYSSDPPMQPREIITLLAVGRAPTENAGLSPDQTPGTSSNSLAEAGGGLIGQAITAQLSSRLQRFFGASRVKIDPTLTGADYLPQAHLTIEQQVSKDISLTYITNLNRTQEQIVELEWDLGKHWSAIAVREANGLFGIDFQYKKRFK